jgi:glucokinase
VIHNVEKSIGVEKFIIIGGFALNVGEPYLRALRKNLVKVVGVDYYGRTPNEIESLVVLGEKDDLDCLKGIGMIASKK